MWPFIVIINYVLKYTDVLVALLMSKITEEKVTEGANAPFNNCTFTITLTMIDVDAFSG